MKSRLKKEIKGEVRDTLFSEGGENEHQFVRRFPATPARPSGRNNVKVKTLW
jgi:hypothetical protein